MPTEQSVQFDYVVVGSGGGGGPVAANLASAGFKVLLIEAGYEYKDLNYDVPAFHAQATQDPEMRWDFFVQHYSDPARQTSQYDSKYVDGKGVLYPRAGTLGGCTAHHALITIYPHNSDWEEIAGIAKTYDPNDDSWSPDRMRASSNGSSGAATSDSRTRSPATASRAGSPPTCLPTCST